MVLKRIARIGKPGPQRGLILTREHTSPGPGKGISSPSVVIQGNSRSLAENDQRSTDPNRSKLHSPDEYFSPGLRLRRRP